MTLEQLFDGKKTIIKNKPYLSTKEYVEPFLDIMSKYTDKFVFQTKSADQLSINQDIQNVYNRVYVQAVLPESYWEYENHVEVIGMVYGLDVRKPVYKLFRSGLNKACTNLCVFSPSFLYTNEIQPESKLDYTPIKHIMEMTSDLEVKLRKMKDTFVGSDQNSRERLLGRWCDYAIRSEYTTDYGKAKLSVSTCVDAYKDLFINEESKYYITKDEEPSIFNIYNAFTDIISHDKKDIMNMAEKTLLLYNMMDV